MYGDDATFGLAAKGLASKSDPSDNWNNLNVKQRTIILDQVPFLQDPNKQKALAPLPYDELMSKFKTDRERYMIDEAILDGLTDDEMKRTSEAFNENKENPTHIILTNVFLENPDDSPEAVPAYEIGDMDRHDHKEKYGVDYELYIKKGTKGWYKSSGGGSFEDIENNTTRIKPEYVKTIKQTD